MIMKELSIEEKAKRYDEALEKARLVLQERGNEPDGASILSELFPELKESEDEKIRKAIYNCVKWFGFDSCFFKDVSQEECLAWLEKKNSNIDNANKEYWRGYREGKQEILDKYAELEKQGKEDSSIQQAYERGYTEEKRIERKHWIEKQGEQKPADNFKQKFKVGDWVVYDHRTYQIVELPQGKFINASLSRNGKTEQAPLPYCGKWTINDAKDGDVLCYKGEVSLYKHDIKNCTKEETTFGGFVYYCCYDGKRFITDSLYSLTEQDKIDIHPATKEQRDLLFSKMKEAGYEWDAEKKELRKIDNEEVNGEDYGIDGLWHAQRILEKTLGSVDGYQTDDGILDHKAAITAVKKLYKQKPTWSEEDDDDAWMNDIISKVENNLQLNKAEIDWLKSIRPQPKQEWSKWDESYLSTTIVYLKDAKDFKKTAENCINWLKSLKQRIGG